MSITDAPSGTVPLVEYDALDNAVTEQCGFHPSEHTPSDFVDATWRMAEYDGAKIFANNASDEYMELVIRIPKGNS